MKKGPNFWLKFNNFENVYLQTMILKMRKMMKIYFIFHCTQNRTIKHITIMECWR